MTITLPPSFFDKETLIIPTDDYVMLYARVQQLICDTVDITDDDKFCIGFDGASDKRTRIERMINLIIDDIGIEMLLKFMVYMFIDNALEDESKFYKRRGHVMVRLIERYNQHEVGYAMSIARSSRIIPDSMAVALVQDKTSLSEQDYRNIKSELELDLVTTAMYRLMGEYLDDERSVSD